MDFLSGFDSVAKKTTLAIVLSLGLACQAFASIAGTVSAVTFPEKYPQDSPLPIINEMQSAETFGWSFTLDNSRTLEYLGLYDTTQGGNYGYVPATVELWDSMGALVASAGFDANKTGVDTSDLANSNFYWKSIAPLVLNAGQTYTLGAYFNATPTNPAHVVYGVTVSSVPGLHYTPSLWYYNPDAPVSGNGNGMPNFDYTVFSPDFTNGFFGPNMRFDAVAPVPVPGTLWLLGSGLLGFFGFSRRVSAQKK